MATVTDVCPDYEGSMGIDMALLEQAGILPYEQIHVFNCNNGARFTTYAIPAESGTGTIQINGAASHLAKTGDKVIVVAYQTIASASDRHPIRKLICNADNSVKEYIPENK